MSTDLLIAKEQEITRRESVTMKEWLLAADTAINRRDRKLGIIAEELLDTGLAAEHWFALLHEDPAQRTPSQLKELADRDGAFEAARKKFSDYMRGVPPAERADRIIERPNAP